MLPNARGGSRLTVLNELSSYLREIEQEEAFNYAVEAEQLAKSLNNKSAEAKAKENIGWIYYRKGQWQKSFDYSKSAYDLAIAGENLQEAARVLNNLGALYYEQHNYTFAIIQFKKAYEISNKASDLYTMIRSLNNVAFNFLYLDEYDSAMYYASRAIDINIRAGSPYMLSFSNRVIGDVYLKRNQLDSAEHVFEKALKNGEARGLTAFNASVLHRLGNTYLLNGKPDKAKKVLLEGVELSRQHSFLDELSKSHKYLADYYKQTGNYKEAFEQQSHYVALNDSLVNRAARDRLALMQGMFQDDLEQSELDLLVAQNEHQTTRLAMNRRIMILIGIGSILIFGLMIWLFILNRNIKRYNTGLILQKRRIYKQKEELEAKSSQLQEINQTKNKLFSILGHDLRGPIGQVKSIVDLLTSGYLDQEEFDGLIHSLKEDVDSVYFTLNNTLRWSMAQMEGFKLHRVNFNLDELISSTLKLIKPQLQEKSLKIVDSSLLTDLEIYADRDLIEVVVRNILNNAVKFSKPGDVIQLSTKVDNGLIVWTVKDQGVGMKEEQINAVLSRGYVISDSTLGTKKEKGSGLGLQICKEFIRMNGGDLHIKSKEGGGTKVSIKIPASKVLESN
ncbi:signal transduction histidine kinase/Tfp pilus assembly protein PilF [Algoriphagus sp. 4150]|uniref:tetratricopeptide repeat-containing sensor histidine kinase n=1 Tax=Algoriphagus sp. 4150 TaxID=2817756 RepID=UPI0028649FF3|nr:tetratricopeptide repeat protein [Algoriphagus sp. 4150]MDR7129582.1 signal transduction histidine kinase/Tfp pilus assembly protein PilF [Algoriphagus sp. 4150]